MSFCSAAKVLLNHTRVTLIGHPRNRLGGGFHQSSRFMHL